MLYIKKHYPIERYETTFLSLWEWMYHHNINISKPEHLADLLKSHHYTETEIKAILAAASSPEYKEALTANTQKALDQGAYGAPWFWVRNAEGREEPFFGSDRLVLIPLLLLLWAFYWGWGDADESRFAFMWQYLGLPFRDVAIIEKAKL